MKIKVFQPLNTRQDGANRTYQKGVVRLPGEVIEVSGIVTGENIGGNDRWFDAGNGNFYWSGGAKIMPDNCPPSKLITQPNKTQFDWFTNLGIQDIWSTYNTYGNGVTVAVLDTGYDLCNRDLAPGVTGQNNLVFPNDTINDNSLTGHGTFCSSIIGARNLFQYTIGIAPKCNLLIGKISIKEEPYDFGDLTDAITWAAKSGASVISISFAQKCQDQSAIDNLTAFIKNIRDTYNILIFAACGNYNPNYPDVTAAELYPATVDGVVSVGATDGAGNLSSVTLLSSKTTIHAQGVGIQAYGLNETTVSGDGTSFATPIIAGVSALAIAYLNANGIKWTSDDLTGKIYSTGKAISGSDTRKLLDPATLFETLSKPKPLV